MRLDQNLGQKKIVDKYLIGETSNHLKKKKKKKKGGTEIPNHEFDELIIKMIKKKKFLQFF